MTTKIRFCLSYDCFKLDIIAFKEDNISTEKHGRRYGVTFTRKSYATCGHITFMT